MITGKPDIVVIQGDSYNKNVEIKGIDLANIEGVYISCSQFNVCQKLIYDLMLEKYVFSLSSAVTKEFVPKVANYDLTIKFTDSKIKTLVYKARFVVLAKTNEVGCLNE